MLKALINNHRCDEDLSDPAHDGYEFNAQDFFDSVAEDEALKLLRVSA